MPPELKVYWPIQQVSFNGMGIGEAWAGYARDAGYTLVDRDHKHEADIAFFNSDSVIDDEVVGKIPTVCYFWGWKPGRIVDADFMARSIERTELMRRCTRLLVPSFGTGDQAKDLGLEPFMLVPGVDADMLYNTARERSPVGRNPTQVIFISRIVPHKGLSTLLDALAPLGGARLVVCGTGAKAYVDEMKAHAISRGVDATWLEPTDREKVFLIQESAVLAFPSVYEGFGLPPLEAHLLGTPTIVYDSPQMRWLLHDTTLYFDSVAELTQRIKTVLNDPDMVRDKTVLGGNNVITSLNLKRATANLGEHLHDAIRDFGGAQIREDFDAHLEDVYNRDHRRNYFFKAQYFDPTWERHWRAKKFISKLRENDAMRILDCGSGPVYPTIFALNAFNVTAFDISTECLKQVGEVAEKYFVEGKVQTRQGRAQDLPFSDGEFDAVILGEILEHVPDPDVVLAEACRVTRVGGIVIASTPIGHHHFDPLHIASEEGGWSEEGIDELLAPYAERSVVTKEVIAEEGTEPSCFLFTITRGPTSHKVDASANATAHPG